MSGRQILILKCCIGLMIAMLLFPPLVFNGGNGFQRNNGYGFLFSRNDGAVVNVALLFAQWFLVAAISGALMYASSSWTPPDQQGQQGQQGQPLIQRAIYAINQGWRRSKFWRSVCLWMIVVDVMVALTQSDNQGHAAANSGMRAAGWVLIIALNFFYHAVRAYVGIPDTTATRKLSLRRVAAVITVIVLGFGAVLFANHLASNTGNFVYQEK